MNRLMAVRKPTQEFPGKPGSAPGTELRQYLNFATSLMGSSTVKKNQLWPFRRFLRENEISFALDYAILVGVVTVALGVALGALSGNLDKLVRALGG